MTAAYLRGLMCLLSPGAPGSRDDKLREAGEHVPGLVDEIRALQRIIREREEARIEQTVDRAAINEAAQ